MQDSEEAPWDPTPGACDRPKLQQSLVLRERQPESRSVGAQRAEKQGGGQARPARGVWHRDMVGDALWYGGANSPGTPLGPPVLSPGNEWPSTDLMNQGVYA